MSRSLSSSPPDDSARVQPAPLVAETLAVSRYLDERDLERLEDERLLEMEGWKDTGAIRQTPVR